MSLISIEHREDGIFDIKVRNHSVGAELASDSGGKDRAPTPSELLAGSLGSCIAIMVDRYCKSHGYIDGTAGVSMTYELADNPRRIGAVTIDLELPKDVPEDKKPAIERVARLCPIHNTLKKPPKIDIEIV